MFPDCRHRLANAGSIEYSIWDDLMTEEGELWQPTEEDTTLLRCHSLPSLAFHPQLSTDLFLAP